MARAFALCLTLGLLALGQNAGAQPASETERETERECIYDLRPEQNLNFTSSLSESAECSWQITETGGNATNLPLDASSRWRPDWVPTPGAPFSSGLRLRPAQTPDGATHVLQARSNHAGELTVLMWVWLPHADHLMRPQTWFSSANPDSAEASNFQFGLTGQDEQGRFSRLCAGNTPLARRNAFDANQGCSVSAMPTRVWTHIAVSIDSASVVRAYINAVRQFAVTSVALAQVGAPVGATQGVVRYASSQRNLGFAFQFGALFSDQTLATTCLLRALSVAKTSLSQQQVERKMARQAVDPDVSGEFERADGFLRNTHLYASLAGDFAVDQSPVSNSVQSSYTTDQTLGEALGLGARLLAPLKCATCDVPQGSYTKTMWLRLMRPRLPAETQAVQLLSNLDTTPELYRDQRLYEFQQHRMELDALNRVCVWHDSGAAGEVDGVSSDSPTRVCTASLERSHTQVWTHVAAVYDASSSELRLYQDAVLQASSHSGCSAIESRRDFNAQTCFEGSKLGLVSNAPDGLLLVRNLAVASGANSVFSLAAQMRQQALSG